MAVCEVTGSDYFELLAIWYQTKACDTPPSRYVGLDGENLWAEVNGVSISTSGSKWMLTIDTDVATSPRYDAISWRRSSQDWCQVEICPSRYGSDSDIGFNGSCGEGSLNEALDAFFRVSREAIPRVGTSVRFAGLGERLERIAECVRRKSGTMWLESLDNPGWGFRVTGLPRERRVDFSVDRSENNWLHLAIRDGIADGACGPSAIGEALRLIALGVEGRS